MSINEFLYSWLSLQEFFHPLQYIFPPSEFSIVRLNEHEINAFEFLLFPLGYGVFSQDFKS